MIDTGSSWTWVYTCGYNNGTLNTNLTCPSNYFNANLTQGINCKDRTYYIEYGSG
jgi:hypothetical protein